MSQGLESFFILTSENLSGLGRMGDTTSTNWERYFSTIEFAKQYAEKDYKGDETIIWTKDRSSGCSSQDLGHVMYIIRRAKITK